jgi:hypothetical protein
MNVLHYRESNNCTGLKISVTIILIFREIISLLLILWTQKERGGIYLYGKNIKKAP